MFHLFQVLLSVSMNKQENKQKNNQETVNTNKLLKQCVLAMIYAKNIDESLDKCRRV